MLEDGEHEQRGQRLDITATGESSAGDPGSLWRNVCARWLKAMQNAGRAWAP